MRRVAIPIIEGRLSEYFGQCNHYEIFEISNDQVKSDEIEVPSVPDIKYLPEWAVGRGVTDIITYKIDKRIIRMFAKYKINLYVGIEQNTSQELIRDYMSGRLNSNTKVINEILEAND